MQRLWNWSLAWADQEGSEEGRRKEEKGGREERRGRGEGREGKEGRKREEMWLYFSMFVSM